MLKLKHIVTSQLSWRGTHRNAPIFVLMDFSLSVLLHVFFLETDQVGSHKVLKPQDLMHERLHRSKNEKVPRQQLCQGACQISGGLMIVKYMSWFLDISRDLMVRRLTVERITKVQLLGSVAYLAAAFIVALLPISLTIFSRWIKSDESVIFQI